MDSPTTFIIGDGSNLKVGKVENIAGAIGSGKLSIDGVNKLLGVK